MERITEKRLLRVVELINTLTDSPKATYTDHGEGANPRLTANIGSYHLDKNIGGWRLCRIVNVGGGTSDISPRLPAGQFYEWLHAFRQGYETSKGQRS